MVSDNDKMKVNGGMEMACGGQMKSGAKSRNSYGENAKTATGSANNFACLL
jgi:hypothetical protein